MSQDLNVKLLGSVIVAPLFTRITKQGKARILFFLFMVQLFQWFTLIFPI